MALTLRWVAFAVSGLAALLLIHVPNRKDTTP